MENLQRTFSVLKALLKPYQPPLLPKLDDETHYDLWTVKDVVIAGRKKTEVFFAGLAMRQRYVSFYCMPIYMAPEIKTMLAPELLALLKGKSCFRIRKLDAELMGQIEAALKVGFEIYPRNGWV